MVVIDRANSFCLMARLPSSCAKRVAVAVTSRSGWRPLRPHARGAMTSSRDWSFPIFRSMPFGLRRESSANSIPLIFEEVAASIGALGFCVPILVGRDNEIIDGEVSYEAAQAIGP